MARAVGPPTTGTRALPSRLAQRRSVASRSKRSGRSRAHGCNRARGRVDYTTPSIRPLAPATDCRRLSLLLCGWFLAPIRCAEAVQSTPPREPCRYKTNDSQEPLYRATSRPFIHTSRSALFVACLSPDARPIRAPGIAPPQYPPTPTQGEAHRQPVQLLVCESQHDTGLYNLHELGFRDRL